MAVTNLYSNLPGHLVEFKDGGLQLTSTTTDTSSTKSILILGTATDGPINEPVKIDSTTVSQVFGKEVDSAGYPNGTTLTKYAKQAFKNGFDDVRCMRITGSQAYTTLTGEETLSYEDAIQTVGIENAKDADQGVIKGNKKLVVDYIQAKIFSGNDTVGVATGDNPQLVPDVAGDPSVNKFTITYNDGTSETHGLSEVGAWSWNPYRGFEIPAGLFTTAKKLHFECKGIKFTGATGTDLVGTDEIIALTADVTEDASHNLIAHITNDAGPYVFRASKSTSANSMYSGFPVFTDDFIVKVNGTQVTTATVVENTDADGKLTSVDVTISDASIVADLTNGTTTPDSYTVSVEFYAYEDSDVSNEFTVADETTSLDVSSTTSLKDAKLLQLIISDGTTSNYVTVDTLDASVLTVSGNTLTINDSHAIGAKAGDVIQANYQYSKAITSAIEIKVKSQWGGSIYKTGKVKVEKVVEDGTTYTNVIFTRPTGKSATNNVYYYSSKYYHTFDDLILAMTNDANNTNMYEIEIVKGEGTDSIDLLEACTDKTLENGGENGINPTANELFKALSGDRYTALDVGKPINDYSTAVVTTDMIGFLKTQGAYQILENYNVDYIYPAGVYADMKQTVNEHSDFQRELALVCAVLTYRTKMTHGFIDVKPNSNTTLVGVDAYVSKLLNGHSNVYYMTDSDGNVIYDTDNKPMDIGWYTSVVVGPEVVMTSDTLGTYYGSPAIAYAALNAVLEPQSAPTNKALRNVNGIKFKFSNKQMDAIVGQRMVCFRLKNEGASTASSTPYVVDGVTAGATNCDYSRIVTVKVLTDVVDQIREVADPFIGEQNTVEQRNALSALISKRLSKLVEAGEIQSYEFEVSSTIQQQLLGEASIALTIIPAMELRKITTVVALRAAE